MFPKRKYDPSWTIMVLSCTTAAVGGAWSRKMIRKGGKLSCLSCSRDIRQFTLSPQLSQPSLSPPHRSMLLAKTKETFKLADLQWLETHLQSTMRNDQDYMCDRLLVDGSTGSSLYSLDMATTSELLRHLQSGGVNQENNMNSSSGSNIGIFARSTIPSSLRRCDWIAEVLCQEATAEQLVDTLRSSPFPLTTTTLTLDGWTLDYIRMEAAGRPIKDLDYNQKTLLCCVSQALSAVGYAALHPSSAQHRLMLVETTDYGIFLTRVLPQLFQRFNEKRKAPLFRVWSRRPFLFSSAINPMVAEIVVDLVHDLLLLQQHPSSSSRPLLRLLDPTCGSGTLLAFFLARGNIEVEGWDINPNCVEGCRSNLEHVFGNDSDHPNSWSVHHHDATHMAAVDSSPPSTTTTTTATTTTSAVSHLSTFDCVVANLPWGQNTVSYAYENQRILTALRHGLRAHVPIVLISKQPMNQDLQQLGFQIIGQAHVPQQDFTLPNKKKVRKREENQGEPKGRSDCVITIASST